MKEFGPPGAHVPGAPLDPPMIAGGGGGVSHMTLLNRKKLYFNILAVILITDGCFSLLASAVLSVRAQMFEFFS